MQPLARDGLTADQVRAIIRDTATLRIGRGLELLDVGLGVVSEVPGLEGGTVSRDSTALVHGRASLNLTTELPWGRALVRPYLTCTGPAGTARFSLGAYYTATPGKSLGQRPLTYNVECFDIVQGLASLTGVVHVAPEGARYLDEVRRVLEAQGYQRIIIDPARADAVLPAARVWPLDSSITWLTVVNDLLGAVGYAPIWSDWDGALRCTAYTSPTDRAPEWTYDTGIRTSQMAPGRSIEQDLYNAPNRWVAIRSNLVDQAAPEEGNGQYTYTNQVTGPTSVEARGGRIITAPYMRIEAVDQPALVAAATRLIEADIRRPARISVKTAPNPAHWHDDRVDVDDQELAPIRAASVTSWSLPLDGGDMTHTWAAL